MKRNRGNNSSCVEEKTILRSTKMSINTQTARRKSLCSPFTARDRRVRVYDALVTTIKVQNFVASDAADYWRLKSFANFEIQYLNFRSIEPNDVKLWVCVSAA